MFGIVPGLFDNFNTYLNTMQILTWSLAINSLLGKTRTKNISMLWFPFLFYWSWKQRHINCLKLARQKEIWCHNGRRHLTMNNTHVMVLWKTKINLTVNVFSEEIIRKVNTRSHYPEGFLKNAEDKKQNYY